MLVFSFVLAFILPNHPVRGRTVDTLTTIWPYTDLVVEKEFLIRKSDDELNNEKEKIKKESAIFIETNSFEKDAKLTQLKKLALVNPSKYNPLCKLLDSIYARGVIESIDTANQIPIFLINQNNIAEPINYGDFFTIATANNFLAANIKNKNDRYFDFLAITHYINQRKSTLFINTKLDQVSIYKGNIKSGEILIKKGEALTRDKRSLINHYFSFQNKNELFSGVQFLGKWLLAFIILLVLLFYLAFFRKLIFSQNKQVAFLFLVVICSLLAVFIFNRYGFNIVSLPFALVPILVRVFFDGRTALFTHLMVVLLCSFFMPDKLEFVLLQLISGIGTLFAIAEMRKRQQILNASILVFLFYTLIFTAYQIGFGTPELVKKISSYIPFAFSSILVLLAYPLIYLTEKLFGFISDFKLLELCDLSQPLLRQLSQDVPGTFQHSLQVANLAEEAIYYIGGNSLLVRAGAMYHDIGKLENPSFFIENQSGENSPHQNMEPIQSAKIIINHVPKGIELAKKHHLPEQIIDFIKTHHGTTSVSYFLNLSKKLGNDLEVTDKEFKYSGPIPFSKETAVLMIADGVEAASRSLKKLDALSIDEMVDAIIDYKIAQNQFINSDITFKDITTIKKIFKKRLMTIYHARIEYPV